MDYYLRSAAVERLIVAKNHYFWPCMLSYFKSKEFFLTILAVIGLGALSYFIFFYGFLPYYTNHGEETKVPDVAEEQLDEAIEKLTKAGLRYEVADSIYLNTMPPLAVISQDPVGKSMVKPDRKVYLTVNKIVAPMVKFPNVIGVSQYQAKLRLEGMNLVIGNLKYVPHEYRNLVLGASFKGDKLKEGDAIRKGSIIDLVVGKGKGSLRIEVPELVGKDYATAIAALHRLGLNMGNRRFDESSSEDPGTIIQQYPNYRPGDSLHLGAEVDMWIAGPEPEEGGDDSDFFSPDPDEEGDKKGEDKEEDDGE